MKRQAAVSIPRVEDLDGWARVNQLANGHPYPGAKEEGGLTASREGTIIQSGDCGESSLDIPSPWTLSLEGR